MLAGLSTLEQEVVNAARRGVWAGHEKEQVEQLADTKELGLRVRVDLIRELLMGLRGDLDPRGVRIRGVRGRSCLTLTGSLRSPA